MLKSLRDFFKQCIDIILPPRSNYDRVRKLTAEKVFSLPEAYAVEGCDWITALFRYRDPTVKAIVWELKYHNNTLPLEHIGRMLYEEIIDTISNIILFDQKASFLLIPIPISPLRRRERGYNQSEYIARSVLEHDLEHTLLYAPQWFEKIKETTEQNKSQSREARLKNLSDSFQANELVTGHYVILIDDVVTTGSTLSEARRTLLSAGARDVFAFTIAH